MRENTWNGFAAGLEQVHVQKMPSSLRNSGKLMTGRPSVLTGYYGMPMSKRVFRCDKAPL